MSCLGLGSLRSLTRTLVSSVSYVTSLAVQPTNHYPPPIAMFTTSTAASSISANAAMNVTTDVLPEPAILQIQGNDNDLEEGGHDFVDIEDMLFDELDLEELGLISGLLRRLLRQLLRRLLRQSLRQLLRRPGQLLRRLLRLQLRLNHEIGAARAAERTKRPGRGGRRLLMVVVYGHWQLRRHLCLLYVHNFKGFRIAQIHRL
jgi:hypothetical protein